MEDAQEFQRDKKFFKKLVEVIGEFQQSVMSVCFFVMPCACTVYSITLTKMLKKSK